MKVAVLGAHGQIAMLLHPILRSNGNQITGLIRNPDHAAEVERAGAKPVVCDVEAEEDISPAVGDADAVIFAAGAGPGSGAERKWSVDRDGALKLIEAAKKKGIRRYVMISAMKAEEPRGNEVFQAYLEAKSQADKALRESGLDYTIIRPGRLTDDLPAGRVTLGPDLESGEIPRADVATVVAEVLENQGTIGHQWDVVSGDIPVENAIKRLV
ncbi:SDR family oxidoreductase [Natronogracilivirga saccharolytica]|uniref:SDR family oxidoreductase n=1 Tax=Natronogracilivirga saccharolytica TaxID=2812953 RepID=A0A8J7RLW1_9BACT|nr:SDR family oxidoreductase [Natronogracilivirga saccharolytica]MBP3193762.1 SDR family oxidoreductase [Natronogracilivirga saccharolytica]